MSSGTNKIVESIKSEAQEKADKIIQDRLLKSENIEVHFKRKPAEILEEDNKVKGLVLENSETGEKEELKF